MKAQTPKPVVITEWQVRVGAVGYAKPYEGKNTTFMRGGKVRMQLTNADVSAGVLGPIVKEGTYTFVVSNRMDVDDPCGVRAIWTYSDATKDEVDVLEATRWSDVNNPKLMHSGAFRAGASVADQRYEVRAFRQYRLTLEVTKGGAVVNQWGVFEDGTEKWVGGCSTDVSPIGHQLRMAYWLMPQGYCFKDSASRGPRIFDVVASYQAPTPSLSAGAIDRTP